MGKDLDDEGRWFAASSPVLPLAKPGDVSQQDAQSDPMELWQLLDETVQLGGALIVSTDTWTTTERSVLPCITSK